MIAFAFLLRGITPVVRCSQNRILGRDAVAAPMVTAMAKEVDNLFEPSGLAVSWRSIAEDRKGEALNRRAAVRFKGRCSLDRQTLEAADGFNAGEMHSLGSTQVSGGRVLPYTEVRCDEVRKALAYLPGAGYAERQRALDGALGRMLAHQLYHILANEKSHAAQGLARAVEPHEDLVSSQGAVFRDEDWKAVAQNLSAH
jgi:hypothetical protein